jgi:hypothetical protein
MKSKSLALSVLLLVSTALPPSWAQSVPAQLAGYSANWSDPAPTPPKDATLGQAIAMLMPSTQGFFAIVQVPNLDVKVTWPEGVSRMEALHDVLEANGLYAMGGSDSLKIYSQTPSDPPPRPVRIVARYVAKAAPAPAHTPAAAPAASTSVAAIAAAPAASAPVAAPAAPSQWVIHKGETISSALKSWAKAAGWVVEWSLPKDWDAPQTTSFSGSFEQALAQVVKALAANGADIRVVIHSANQTAVVRSAGN